MNIIHYYIAYWLYSSCDWKWTNKIDYHHHHCICVCVTEILFFFVLRLVFYLNFFHFRFVIFYRMPLIDDHYWWWWNVFRFFVFVLFCFGLMYISHYHHHCGQGCFVCLFICFFVFCFLFCFAFSLRWWW